MVELAGRLANPAGPLKAVLSQERSNAKTATDLIASPRLKASDRHKHVGWVVEAVERVLGEHSKPMQAKAVHQAIETELGHDVSWSSVKNALASGASGRSARFVRVGVGRYQLRP
jgi:hypothetical protein